MGARLCLAWSCCALVLLGEGGVRIVRADDSLNSAVAEGFGERVKSARRPFRVALLKLGFSYVPRFFFLRLLASIVPCVISVDYHSRLADAIDDLQSADRAGGCEPFRKGRATVKARVFACGRERVWRGARVEWMVAAVGSKY